MEPSRSSLGSSLGESTAPRREVGAIGTGGTPPALALLQQALGFFISRAICVVARLGIADLLKDGPLDTESLAAAAGVHAPSLYRVLRTLARVGIFAEGDDGRFGLTPRAEPLRSDAPDSIRDYILLLGEEWYSGPSDHLLHSVQTGRSAFEHVHGADFFTFVARNPAAGPARSRGGGRVPASPGSSSGGSLRRARRPSRG